MALSETKIIDQITVTENGIVLYREATRIIKDGEQIAQTFHRTSIVPATDLTNVPANVAAICNAAWTEEVVAAYQTSQVKPVEKVVVENEQIKLKRI